jgi:hypothetical protein
MLAGRALRRFACEIARKSEQERDYAAVSLAWASRMTNEGVGNLRSARWESWACARWPPHCSLREHSRPNIVMRPKRASSDAQRWTPRMEEQP